MSSEAPIITAPTPSKPLTTETRFVNAMRLSARQWLSVAAIVVIVVLATPAIWKKIERLEIGPDYRVPYGLSKDYWLYERRLQRLLPSDIVIVGDSVVWGEYVRSEGTLSHFLNEQQFAPSPRESTRFVNAGVNGLFPLVLEGLIRDYGGPLRRHKVILHCNLLWISSPKADLHTEKEERFNHADLVPQFSPRIPCYKADINHRLAAIVERHFAFSQFANHLQIAYFGRKNVLSWTLEEDPNNPANLPNAYKNPLKQITLKLPNELVDDAERGPGSSRHKPWSTSGSGSTRFDWVPLEQSLQWGAFQRTVKLLQSRGNDVLVLLGPFNEHIMAPENRAAFRPLRDGVLDWLTHEHIAHIAPDPLPSTLYADASHPLSEGYEMLAKTLSADRVFQQFAASKHE